MEELKKNIGFFTIFVLLITSLLGTGLFFAPAVAARIAGSGSIISWIIMLLISVYLGFCFAELVSLFPNAGGIYEYSKKAYGRFPSFILGWITWLVNTINTPLLIVAALYIAFPTLTHIQFILISVLIIIFMNYVSYRGMKDSSLLLFIFAGITLVVMFAFIYNASSVFNPSFVFPITISDPLKILVAIFFISESFYGWGSATFLAEETKNARVVIPRALIITTLFIGILSVTVAILSLGIIPMSELISNPAYFSQLISTIFSSSIGKYFLIGIFIVFLGSAAGNIISTPRLLLAMSRDKLFIEQFAQLDKKNKTPYKAIIFQAIVGILLVFISLGNYEILLSLLIPPSLIGFIAILIAIPVLRKKYPDKKRFKSPLPNFLPYFVSILFLFFIGSWLYFQPGSMVLFRYVLGFFLFGLPVYLLLNVYYNPDFTISINDLFSKLNLWFENLLFPKSIRQVVLSLFKDYNARTILEFGSGVGSLTMLLVDKVGISGKIYAVDFSKKNIDILNHRLLKKGDFQVTLIHDKHIVSRVHPTIKYADMIFSVGMLGYIQNLKKILSDMYDILPDGGKICFIEYMDYFHILPNPKYLSHKRHLDKLFREMGFSVRIQKLKGVFWNYSLIYGIKTRHNDLPFI